MLAPFFQGQRDFIFFVYGLAFLLLSALCLALHHQVAPRLPWLWLGLFGLIHGVNAWQELLAVSVGDSSAFTAIRLGVMAASFLCLIEFGRSGWHQLGGRALSRWLYVPLLAASALGALAGPSGLNAASRYVLGLIGGSWSVLTLFRASKIETVARRSLQLTAGLMAVYAFTIGVIVPQAAFFPASMIHEAAFYIWTGIPVELIRGALAVIICLALWTYYQSVQSQVRLAAGQFAKAAYGLQIALVLAIVVLAGWLFTDSLGKAEAQQVSDDVLNQTKVAAAAIRPESIQRLSLTPADTTQAYFQRLQQQLSDIQYSDANIQRVYVLSGKADSLKYAVDSTQRLPPGTILTSPPSVLNEVLATGRAVTIGPYTSDDGIVLTGFAAMRDPVTQQIIAALGLDYAAYNWQTQIAGYRLLPIGITLLIAVLFIAFFVVRDQMWATLQRNAAREAQLIEAQQVAQLGSWTLNLATNQFTWSATMFTITGFDPHRPAPTYTEFQSALHPDDATKLNAILESVKGASADADADAEWEYRFIQPDGTTRYLVSRFAAQRTPGGKVNQIAGTTQDITERKQAEEQLRQLSRAVDQSPVSIVITDSKGAITYVNPKFSQITGYSLEEAIGQNPRILKSDHTSPEEYAELWQTISAGQTWRGEFHNKKKNGELYWELASISPIMDEHGRVTYYLAVKEDITERKQVEEAIQRERSLLRTLIDNLPDVVYIKDVAGRKIVTNRVDVELVGAVSEADVLGKTDLELFPNEVGARGYADDQAVVQTGQPLFNREEDFVDANGMRRWLLTSKVPLFDEHGHSLGLLGIGHDITERKQAEKTLQRLYQEMQSEKQYFESLVMNNPAATVVISSGNEVVSWNPAAEQLFGYTPAEAIGRNIDDLISNVELRAEATTYSQQATTVGSAIHTLTHRVRKDGTLVDVDLSAVPVIVDGVVIGALAIYHDITELERARQEAEAATRAKSAFLAMMSHEIRTPMNGVIGMTSLLLDTELTAEQRDYAETIRNSGEALLTIINDILDFSKIEAGRMELENQPFDVRDCVESALDLVSTKAREKGLELAYLIDAQTPAMLLGDVTRLRQILINLLGNAIKFTDKGEVVVSVEAQSAERREEHTLHTLHFAVKDTGLGIPPDRVNRLFQSFSQVDTSTTRKYGGTGLGLAISKRLSELMTGTMWVESDGVPGRGSTFHFTIQVAAAPAQARVYRHTEQPQLRDRRVLIVDDNATNRRVLVGQTRSWNMLPRETASPHEALEWIQRGDPFDLALLDMQMPEMDGVMLAKAIRQHRDAQSLPLVMLSSLGRKELGADSVHFAAYLTKPIKQSMLYDALVEVFAGEPKAAHTREPAAASQFDALLAERLPLRLLVAEDNAVNQKLALQMLRKMGYRADVAANGLEVLEALERQPYDVVLMDVQMPEMDGLEATRQIRSLSAARLMAQPRIVAMTANAMQGDREMCLAAGMDDYMSKPIQVKDLQAALERWGQPLRPIELATPPAVPTATIDWAVLKGLSDLQAEGEPDFAQEMIDLYLENAPLLIEAIRRTITDSEPANLQRSAHTLKGNSASLGAQQLSALSFELEKLGRAGTVEDATALLTELVREFDRVRMAFQARSTSV